MERSRDWMASAAADLEHACSDRDRGFHNWACFSAQQAAEKAVRAVFQKMMPSEEALPPDADPLVELPALAVPGGPRDGSDRHDAYLIQAQP